MSCESKGDLNKDKDIFKKTEKSDKYILVSGS